MLDSANASAREIPVTVLLRDGESQRSVPFKFPTLRVHRPADFMWPQRDVVTPWGTGVLLGTRRSVEIVAEPVVPPVVARAAPGSGKRSVGQLPVKSKGAGATSLLQRSAGVAQQGRLVGAWKRVGA